MNINFFKDYKFYYNVYKILRMNYNEYRIKIYRQDNNYKALLYTEDDMIYSYIEIIKKPDLEERINNKIKEEIAILSPDIDNYKYCLKNKYYKNDYMFDGFRPTTQLNLYKCLSTLNSGKIYNMLNIDIYKNFYFQYNDIRDLLDLKDISNIKINNIEYCFLITDDSLL